MGMTVDEGATLVRHTKHGFIATCFDVTTQNYKEQTTTLKAIRINRLTLIEIQPCIWCLTDFKYIHKYFKCMGKYKELVTCFVEILPDKSYETQIQVLEDTNLGTILDLVTDDFEQLSHKSFNGELKRSIYEHSLQFQISFSEETHTIKNFKTIKLCLFEDQESYTNQINQWIKKKEEEKRAAQELMSICLSDMTKEDLERMNEEDKQRIQAIMGDEWLEGILNKQ